MGGKPNRMGQRTQQELTSCNDGEKCVCVFLCAHVQYAVCAWGCTCNVCLGLYVLDELEVHVRGRLTNE